MSHQWETEFPSYEEYSISAQRLSQQLTTAVEDSNAVLVMSGQDEDPFRATRPSTTVSFPPRSSSMPIATEPTPIWAREISTLEYPPAAAIARYPPLGRTESLFRPFRPITLMTDPPRPFTAFRNPTALENLPAGSTVRYPASERPASTTASLPSRQSSNSTPAQRTTLDSRPEIESYITEEERACCLACAKKNVICVPRQSQIKQRCMLCINKNIACTPIPAEYLPGYLAMKQIFREDRTMDGYDAFRAWVVSTEATTPLARIERHLFLLNRNVERLLKVHLSAIGESAPRLIEEEFSEN